MKRTWTHGYSHWGGKEPPDAHAILLIPHSIMDGWEAYCSCDQWKAFSGLPSREATFAALSEAHQGHLQKAGASDDA